jgi:hypothetical protein
VHEAGSGSFVEALLRGAETSARALAHDVEAHDALAWLGAVEGELAPTPVAWGALDALEPESVRFPAESNGSVR